MQAKLLKHEPTGRTWEGKDGTTFYVHTVEFSDGTIAEANSISDTPNWVIGSEYSFDKTTNKYGTTVKGLKQVAGNGAAPSAGRSAGSSASFSASYAKDIYIAKITSGDVTFTSKEFFLLADKIKEWIDANS